MTTKQLITLALIISLGMGVQDIYAQFVPKNQRKSQVKLQTIKIAKRAQATVKQPVLYCDTLIMEDGATLKVPYTLKSFTLYAKYCKVGNNCTITSRGKSIESLDIFRELGKAGSNAAHINLYLNIYKIGHLTIDATGGNGEKGRLPGIYGAGGNVNLNYYSPVIIKIKKHRRATRSFSDKIVKRRKHNHPTIIVKNKVGWMDSRRFNAHLHSISQVKTMNNFRSEAPNLIADPVLANSGQVRNTNDPMLNNSARLEERKRRKRKDGDLKINRRGAFISPADVKIQ
ncbi:hypothetical protein BKI52_00705 [marine bacterium AO1-C]|nr:hypothetical protein BKI52_00705 [marine bacterium AO1-C]